ncbi:MAG: CHASE2 domain-containing protein [Leptolyngbyaceae cyanobacterium SM2_3_12]|nr:CHASE2 domain-containing protein [Leptolyngbyaceae cyanobacterium SM2_3_12]
MKAVLKTIIHKLQRLVRPEFIHPWGSPELVAGAKIVLLSTLLGGTLVTGFRYMGGFEPAELFLFDYLVRLQPKPSPDPHLTIVGITEEDIQQYGWPLSDGLLAALLAQLQIHRPQVIGLDLYRSTLRPPGSEALVTQLGAQNLIAIEM